MFIYIKQQKDNLIFRAIVRLMVFVLSFLLIFSPSVSYAQSVLNLPAPNAILPLSPVYNSAIMKGIRMYPEQPFNFDFIVDTADSQFNDTELETEANKLIKYFLAALTTPDNELWVNLSPFEKDRIIPENLGNTQMGRDLLSQDYILKQITASLIYPEDELGSDFWQRVYEKANRLYGTSEIPVNTFNKVWIVPEKAVVYENGDTVYVSEAHLRVMLEEDYLALQKSMENGKIEVDEADKNDIERINNFASDIIEELILPEIEYEVNHGKNFSTLRQIYHSMILASWYKRTLNQSILSNIYVGKNLTEGVEVEDKKEKQKIYDKYLEAFEKGVFNYIKEDYDSKLNQIVPRKYFSGGNDYAMLTDEILDVREGIVPKQARKTNGRHVVVKGAIDPIYKNGSSSPITRRDFLKGAAVAGALALFNPTILIAQVIKALENSDVQAFFKFFIRNSNPNTGFSISHFGDNDPYKLYGAQTYDISLRAIGEAGQGGIKILNTFMRNNTRAGGENAPQTLDINYNPSGGVLNNIRVKNFNEPGWWNKWEFKISAGDNAWVGMAALQNYAKNKDSKLLRFSMERADFLAKLQDKDGGLRFGPRGQFHESGDTSFFWNIKSTENNESALYFFDMLYEVTRDKKYKAIADKIYEWLINEMYDSDSHVFRRGESYINGDWVKDNVGFFAPDTTSWAPLERMLNDNKFGSNRSERLREFEQIIQTTEKLAGVYQGEVLKGISYSPQSRNSQVISIEWSSQFALRYWRMAQEYSFLMSEAKDRNLSAEFSRRAQLFSAKYDGLINQIGGYFKKRDDAFVAPYAVFPSGEIAPDIPTGHGWNTPRGYASVANVYYGFAVAKFDPQILDKSMLGNRQGSNLKEQGSFESKIMGAMSEGDRGLFDDLEKRLNAVAQRYGWDRVFQSLESNRTDDDFEKIESALSSLISAGITKPQIDIMRDRIIPVNVSESRLEGKSSRLGGLIISHGNVLKVLLPRGHIESPNKTFFGDLLHELVEVELLEANVPKQEAHEKATKVNGVLALYGDIEEGLKAVRLIIEELRDEYGIVRRDGVVGARHATALEVFAPNLTGENAAVSTYQIQGEYGVRDVKVKHPVYYQADGRLRTLNEGDIRSAITKAIYDLQIERSDFDISAIGGIEIVSDLEYPILKKREIIEIPLEAVVLQSDLSDAVVEENPVQAKFLRDEILKVFLYYEEGESHGIAPEELDTRSLRYLANLKPIYSTAPYYSNAPPVNYRVVVPIYNEGDKLEAVLNRIKSSGYLDRITFVNDASTDDSRDILEQWEREEGIEVLHLKENKKKEGAIREVLEKLEREGRLTDKIILLDADSFIAPVDKDKGLDEMIEQAAAHMDSEGIVGMGFRYDIDLPEKPSWLQKAQYAEFAGLRFANRVASNQHQLWVINGRGGIFQSDILLSTLRNMEYDFETGDLLITVKMMKEGYKVAYFDKIKVNTMDVTTIADYFKQRRRWERGTTKVFFNELGFYSGEIKRLSKIGIMSIFNIGVRIGLPLGVMKELIIDKDPVTFFTIELPMAMAAWAAIGAGIAISDSGIRKENFTWKIIKWSMMNTFLYTAVTIPARAAGLYDTIKYFVLKERSSGQVPSTEKELIVSEILQPVPVIRNVKILERSNEADNTITSSLIKSENPGGIDLNPNLLDFELRGRGIDFAIPLDIEAIQSMQINGFSPVIFQIIPANLPLILGEVNFEEKSVAELSYN